MPTHGFGRCDGHHRIIDCIRAFCPRGFPPQIAAHARTVTPALGRAISRPHRCFCLCGVIMVAIRLGGWMCEVAHTLPRQIGRGSRFGHRSRTGIGSGHDTRRTDYLSDLWERSRHQTQRRHCFSAVERQRLYSLPRYHPDCYLQSLRREIFLRPGNRQDFGRSVSA